MGPSLQLDSTEMVPKKPIERKRKASKGRRGSSRSKSGGEDEGVGRPGSGGGKTKTGKEGPRPQTRSQRSAFPIVGIGASAGGLEALEELLGNTPADTGMAFVVVTHLHPGHTSLLPELLGKAARIPVLAAEEGSKVEPDHVYVGPPGGHLAIERGTLHRIETESKEAPRLPIDHFFRSLAAEQKERAICVVLSGTGTDGTLGLKAIKGESGMAMVQEPQSARYAGMPSSAIATAQADYVLPPAAMPQQLVAYARGPYLTAPSVATEPPAALVQPLQQIFRLLRRRTGHDFSAYKSTTVRRRIERRMNVHQITEPPHYVRYLQENPHEIDFLFKDLLITVTSFFRDPAAWEALPAHLQHLVQSRPEGHTLRVWVPGCATGEEAFSLAICLHEALERTKRRLDVQVFGTDLDSEAIEAARSGRYPDGIAVDVSPERLERYFRREDSSYRIGKEIRDMTVFAPQNAIKDPPFTKLDALSCRNLLIYLSAELQAKLLPLFHYSLSQGGLLFIGPSESIGAFTDLFEPLDQRWKIYRRRETVGVSRVVIPATPSRPLVREDAPSFRGLESTPSRAPRISTLIQRLLVDDFAPPSVVVSERGDIVYIHGRTGAYLEPASGEPRNNVLGMAREGLELELAAVLRECARKEAAVRRDDVRVKANGELVTVSLTCKKIQAPAAIRGLFLLSFHPTSREVSESDELKPPPAKTVAGERVLDVERELQHLRESHQTALEQLETSNEELKSTNEELQSTNEELQSTNEELETSKEELQSLNEELTTVNSELQSKLEELSQANDDMLNLLNSTDIATVFLDGDLNIKRFTEQAKSIIMLRQTDVGRPLSELASNLEVDDLATECRKVLDTLAFRETEVETKDGGAQLMRIMPYRTSENVIDGLVLTFVDISRLKEAERAAESARNYFASIVDMVSTPLLVLDESMRVESANGAFYRTFETTAAGTEGESIYALGGARWDTPQLRKALDEILPKNARLEGYELKVRLPNGCPRTFLLNAQRLKQATGSAERIFLALEAKSETESDSMSS